MPFLFAIISKYVLKTLYIHVQHVCESANADGFWKGQASKMYTPNCIPRDNNDAAKKIVANPRNPLN